MRTAVQLLLKILYPVYVYGPVHCNGLHAFYHVYRFVVIHYTLLQKKRNFSGPIFPGDPGSLTLTPGHVHFVKWF